MSEQDSCVIRSSSLWVDRLLWGAVVTALALAGTLPTPAHGQLSGTWDIVVDDCCTDPDGETSCDTEGLSIIRQANGKPIVRFPALAGGDSAGVQRHLHARDTELRRAD